MPGAASQGSGRPAVAPSVACQVLTGGSKPADFHRLAFDVRLCFGYHAYTYAPWTLTMSTENLTEKSRIVREARQSLGLTQAQLAERLKVSANYVYQVESGRRSPGSGMLALLETLVRGDPHNVTPQAHTAREWHTVYEIKGSASEFLLYLDDEDLQKYLMRALASPCDFPEPVYAALTKENFRRKNVEKKTGAPYAYPHRITEPRKEKTP